MSENLTPGTFTPADYTPDKNTIKPLQPFRFWCQHVLPLVYDDSLSYYELLCKVVDYLNKTMEDVDLLSQDVSNIFTAYGELQTFVNDHIKDIQDWTTEHVTDLENFVNNYFNNLNVQTEINNKLDAMVLDGTLDTIVYNVFHTEVLEDVQHIVATWIANNLLQEAGYVLDNSLTVENAAADAKAAGDAIFELTDSLNKVINGKTTIPKNNFVLGSWFTNSTGNEQYRIRTEYGVKFDYDCVLTAATGFRFSTFKCESDGSNRTDGSSWVTTFNAVANQYYAITIARSTDNTSEVIDNIYDFSSQLTYPTKERSDINTMLAAFGTDGATW